MPPTHNSNDDTLPLPAPDLSELVVRRMEQTEARVFSLELDGREVWIKRAARPELRSRIGYACMRAISFVSRLEILRPCTEPGGPQTLRNEALLLRDFRSRGVRVPEVIAFAGNSSWLAASSIGQSLGRRAKQASVPLERRELLVGAARALAEVHRAGCVHGAPLPRNLCVEETEGGRCYGFLDFEDHPEGRMSVPCSQARDLLLLVWGSASWAERDPDLLPSMLRAWCEADAAPGAWEEVRSHARLARWFFAPLRPLRRLLGKDLRRALITVDALKAETARPSANP